MCRKPLLNGYVNLSDNPLLIEISDFIKPGKWGMITLNTKRFPGNKGRYGALFAVRVQI